MIKIKFITVGKIKEKSLKNLIDEYIKRLTRYAKVEQVEINDMPVPENPSDTEIDNILSKEGNEIIKHISTKSYVVSLCIEGNKISSEKFAGFINKTQLNFSEIVFIIGSSHGLCDSVKNISNSKISMSDMTFPHNLAQLMLIEQVYRAFKINNNENYHK